MTTAPAKIDPEAAFPDLEVRPRPGIRGGWVATARTLRDSAGAEHPLCPWFPSRRRPIGSGPSAEHARREAARRAATILAYGPLTDGDLLRRGRAVALRLPYDGLQEGQPDWFAFAYAFPHPDEDDGPCP